MALGPCEGQGESCVCGGRVGDGGRRAHRHLAALKQPAPSLLALFLTPAPVLGG